MFVVDFCLPPLGLALPRDDIAGTPAAADALSSSGAIVDSAPRGRFVFRGWIAGCKGDTTTPHGLT